MFDGGEVKIYKITDISQPGDMPVEGLALQSTCYFEERSIGMTRNYMAMQSNAKVDRLIRIWQDRAVTVDCVCVIFDGSKVEDYVEVGVQYRVAANQHTVNENGLKVTDLTLERLGTLYDIS